MIVKFSELSAYKLSELVNYLMNNWSETAADHFLNKVDIAIERLKSFPYSAESYEKDPTVRKYLVTEQTSFYYQVEGNVIFILTVVDNRQNPEKIAKEIYRLFGH